MTHLKHILAVVVPLVVVAASSIAVSPTAQHFAAAHPGLVAYILLGAGVLRAIWKAYTSEPSTTSSDAPGAGSATMGAK